MKQDPILPSVHVCKMQAPPKRMVPFLQKIGSSDYMIGESLIALLLHGLCVLVALLCMEIPKHDSPLHSTIEVAFEAPVALPIPQDVENIDQSDLSTSVVEPAVLASENLPQTDSIAPILVSRQQNSTPEKKKNTIQSSPNKPNQESASHTVSANSQLPITPRALSQPAQTSSKIISATERCSSLSKEYPIAAKRRHEEGVAKVRFNLLADGKINQTEVIESTGYSDLDRAAIQAVQNMKCTAAPGQPVIKTNIPVNFSLNKKR